MASAEKKGGKKKHVCHHPLGPDAKTHGPWLDEGDTLQRAQLKWAGWLRVVSNMRPVPRTVNQQKV